MKIKTILIAITCTTALLFTSCEKGEMEQDMGIGGSGGGGGMENATDSPIITLDSDAVKSYPDSLLYTSDDQFNY